MLYRNGYIGRIAPTCFADFANLTRERFLLPANPVNVSSTFEEPGAYEELHSGMGAWITPARYLYAAADFSARRSKRPVYDITFAENTPAEFIRQMRQWQDAGRKLGIYLPAALPQPHAGSSMHRKDKDPMWTDGTGWFYTSVYPFVEQSLVLYDRAGTVIYRYGGKASTVNTYGITVDGSEGRVKFPTTLPALGEVYAEYDHLIYGVITEVPVEAVPGGKWATYAPQITIQSLAFPVVTRAYRLHLSGTPPTGVDSSLIPPAVTESATTPRGKTTPVLGGLRSTVLGSLYSASQTINDGASTYMNLFGKWASFPLADQVISAGTIFRLQSAGVHANGNFGAAFFAYLWRPGIGRVASLIQADYSGNALAINAYDYGAGARNSITSGVALGSPLVVQEGDRVVMELWSKTTYNGSSAFAFDGGLLDAEYAQGTVLAPTEYSMWLECSNLLYLYEE